MSKKKIIALSFCVVQVITLFLAYKLGYFDGRWAQAIDVDLYLDEVRKLDGQMMIENADTSFLHNLAPR